MTNGKKTNKQQIAHHERLERNIVERWHEDKETNDAIDVLANHFKDYSINAKDVEHMIMYLLDKISNKGDNENVFNAIEKWVKNRK